MRNSDVRYEEVFGGFAQQKIFVETQKMRPPDLPASVTREVKTCTVQTGSLNPALVTAPGKGTQFYEAKQDYCMFPPDRYIDAVGFPEHWHWCKGDELLEPIKPFFTCPDNFREKGCGLYAPGMPWFDPDDERNKAAGKLLDPEEYFRDYVYDIMAPGYRCELAGLVPWFQSECYNGGYNKNANVYQWCGRTQDGTTKWDKYEDTPSGPSVAYFHGYQVCRVCARPPIVQRRARVLLPPVLTCMPWRRAGTHLACLGVLPRVQVIINTSEEVCPTVSGAIGAALGYLGIIELAATLVIVSLFVGIGIAKPRNENASIFNMLKGAGMAEFEEKLEKIRLKEQEAAKAGKTMPDKQTV